MILGFFLTAFHATLGIVTQSQWKILPSYQDTKQKPRDFSDHDGYGSIWNLFFSDHLIEIIALIETKEIEISTKTEILGDSGYFMASANLNPNVGDFFKEVFPFGIWRVIPSKIPQEICGQILSMIEDGLFLLCRDPSQS